MTSSGPLPTPRRPQDDASSFFVRIDFVGARLQVGGPLFHRTTHVFTDAARTLVSTDADSWVIDVAGLTDCDVTGLRAIGGTYRLALRHGRQLTLVGAPPWLRRALAGLHLDHHLLVAGPDAPAAAERISA